MTCVVVDLPLSGNKVKVVEEIASLVMDIKSNKPDSGVLFFWTLTKHLFTPPTKKQYVQTLTCGNRTLDLCYSNIPSAYKTHYHHWAT